MVQHVAMLLSNGTGQPLLIDEVTGYRQMWINSEFYKAALSCHIVYNVYSEKVAESVTRSQPGGACISIAENKTQIQLQ